MEQTKCRVCGYICDNAKLTDGCCLWCYTRTKAVGKIVKKNSASLELSDFDPVFYKDYKEWIEVTEWQNGEGVDIHIENKDKETNVSLHIDELDAIASLLDRIGYLPKSYCPKDETEK